MSDDESSELDVRRIADNPATLEQFYRQHVHLIETFIARRTDDPHRVADLTADVFVAAIESADRYRADIASPTGWLYGVAHNVVAGDRRRSFRERHATARIAGRRLLEDDDIARLVDRIDAEAAHRTLARSFADLATVDRHLLTLIAVDGLTIAAAAHALGLTATAARVRLHRLRRRLAETVPTHPFLTWPEGEAHARA